MIEGLIFSAREAVDTRDLRAAYRGVFSNPAGRLVLADIISCIKRPPLPGQNAEERAFNDGERALALRIVRKVSNTEGEHELC